ncbi:MAG: TonB family protein [Methylobacterium sp.]|uniref:energy transducer TonB n=1 Tax=Methylobacterium sp. TaxID=409 RepID=UPI00345185A5|nr:TonB family protein [Methylobacterium sp.]
MGLRAFACRTGLCAVLLVTSQAQAREQVSAKVQDWLSAVIMKIDEANGRDVKPSRRKSSREVIVRVQIAADGFVNRVDVERSSGSPDLDERARSLVRAASPFSPPPSPLLTKAGTTDLSFPLRLGR